MDKVLKIALLILLPFSLFSQHEGVRFTEKFGPLNSVYKQQNDFANHKPLMLPWVSEDDIIWSKITWEIIDLREKENLPLYYPTDTIEGRKSAIDGRKSLIMAIVEGIKSNNINAYRVPFKLNAFEFDINNAMDLKQIQNIGMREGRIEVEIAPGITDDSTIYFRWEYSEIKQILIKEIWFFDRNDSRLRNEIIGLCPIREFHPLDRNFKEDLSITFRQRLFWIYYPDARDFFSRVPVYSTQNDQPQYSFDDVFTYRLFSSYFVKESNVYNDRLITDYATGREAQAESERIKQEIFDFEQDMWEN
ncbi:MAG: gliding motility protein GldN [Prolixibacteraceae bacterium]|nr:gliding motility protein GldN [Prolixibacteraceae bacterium]